MMYEILVWLGNGFALYRAGQDAGLWWLQFNTEQTQNYLESLLITKGML